VAVLVCGVGYIGAALAGHLLGAGQAVVGLDNLFSTDRGAIDALVERDGLRFVQGDVAESADVAAALDAADVSTVYLLAAQSSSNDGAVDPAYTERANLRGPRVVLEACAARGVGTVVLGSSLRVYGQPLPPGFDECAPYGRQSDLSHLSKLYAEKLLELHAGRRPMRAVAARLAIVYGLGPVMKRDPSFMTVPNRFAWQACRGETLRVNPGQGMVQLLHLEDAVRALARLADWSSDGYQPVNVLGEECALGELASLVVAAALARGIDARAEAPRECPEPSHGRSRLTEAGFAPRRELADGLGELVEYFRGGTPA
jgi:nucleoside-diphosphate-sugar epimerase